MSEYRLKPKSKILFAVRWFKGNGTVGCEYYVSEPHAHHRFKFLQEVGKYAELYETDVEWYNTMDEVTVGDSEDEGSAAH